MNSSVVVTRSVVVVSRRVVVVATVSAVVAAVVFGLSVEVVEPSVTATDIFDVVVGF